MPLAAIAQALDHQQLFLERYDRLLKWAFQLTKPDRELAKDLVQEAFVQFTLSAGDLIAINNIDNYLYGVVRNTHLSHLRRSARKQHEQLPASELDGPANPFLVVDPRRHIQVKDELRAICHYACARKESSITGGVLILRFFHGYFPSEVARLLNSSRNAVDVQLRSARFEAIAYLKYPNLSSYARHQEQSTGVRGARLTTDLFAELRQEVFGARRGECFHLDGLRGIYRTRKALTRSTLSHLVSCAACLDNANRILGLPLLNERSAIDVLNRESDGPSTRLIPLYSFVSSCVALATSGSLWLSVLFE